MDARFPLVSVVVPAFNAESYLSESLESVFKQDYPNLELVVVNDGSTDNTHNLARRILHHYSHVPASIIDQENLGVASARNVGCLSTRGTYLAFLDADDIWESQKLAEQVEVLAARPELIAVTTAYQMFTGNAFPLGKPICPQWYDDYTSDWLSMYAKGSLISSTMVVHREIAIKAGLFDTKLTTSADAEFAYRLHKLGPIEAIESVLVMYRQSESQMHRQAAALRSDYERLVTKSPLADDPKLRRRCTVLLRLRLARMQGRGVVGWAGLARESLFILRHLDIVFGKIFRGTRPQSVRLGSPH